MTTSRRSLLLTAAGVSGAALAVTTAGTVPATAATGSGVAWLNVMDYGAKGDGVTDDQPAIQSAIAAAVQGSTVYFPPAKYALGSPLTVSLGITLRGDWAPHFAVRTNTIDSSLTPLPTFTNTAAQTNAGPLSPGVTTTALIIVNPAPDNGTSGDPTDNSAYGGGPRLYGLALWGNHVASVSGTAIDGIQIASGTYDVALDKVTVWAFSGNGVNAQASEGCQFNQVVASFNGRNGFTWNVSAAKDSSVVGMSDTDLNQCYSQANSLCGFDILNPNAVTMVDCRSEWNRQQGFNITGVCDSLVLVGCNTDRSGYHGFNITAASGGLPVILTGCVAKRDGSVDATTGGTSYAGFAITGSAATPATGAVLTGCSVTIGRDDGVTTGPVTPAYAVKTASLATGSTVNIIGGQFLGSTAPFEDTANALVRHSGVAAATSLAGLGGQPDVHVISAVAGQDRDLQFWSRNQGPRWTLRTTAGAESSKDPNAGSDFAVVRSNAQGEIDSPITVSRATGTVTVGLGGLALTEGTDAKMGVVTLNGATAVTVPTTAVTLVSRIFLTIQAPGGTPGTPYVSGRSAGTSFSVRSAAGDTSTVAWLIVEPA